MNFTRDTYRYHVKRGNQILHRDITSNLENSLKKHKETYGEDVTIQKIGAMVDRDIALLWKKEGGKCCNPIIRIQ